MTEAVEMWYPIPNKTDSISNFSAWCHATEIFQADLYKSEIQFYRRGSGLPERQLGSLYWQLEDICVAPTWAGIEYDGRWKVLHYTAKDIYEHVIIAPYYNNTTGNLSAWVTSDLWESAKGIASWTWYDRSGKVLNQTQSKAFEVGAINSTEVFQGFVNESLPSGTKLTNAVLQLNVTATGTLPNSNGSRQTFTHSNWLNPTALKDAELVDSGLTLRYNNSSNTFTVEATKGVAAWVWLDYPGGVVLVFDSNAFWLAKGEKREIGYAVKSDTTGGKWVHGVTVQSLWNQTLSI